jgi:hypothetical protein
MEYPYYVYAVIEREHIMSGSNIVRIGRTSRGLEQRMDRFPKGSLMFASFPIRPLDIKTAEKRVLTMAKASFRAMPFYGKKCFQGDIDDIHKLIFEATRGYNPSNKDMIDAMDNTAP